VAGGGVDGLGHARGGPVTAAVVRRAQVRAALHDLARDAGPVSSVGTAGCAAVQVRGRAASARRHQTANPKQPVGAAGSHTPRASQATDRRGCSRTSRPPRSFSVLAASISVRIEAVSAKLNPGASSVSSSVAPEISELNLATETRSVSPDSVITGPDSRRRPIPPACPSHEFTLRYLGCRARPRPAEGRGRNGRITAAGLRARASSRLSNNGMIW